MEELLHLIVRLSTSGDKEISKTLRRLEAEGQRTEDQLGDIGDGADKGAKKTESAGGRILKTLSSVERKAKDVNRQSVSLKMDLKGAGEVTSGLEAIKNRRDSLDRGKITLSTTLRGASEVIGELGTLEGVSSRIDGDKVLLTADVDGTEEGKAGLLSLQSVASRIDGDNLRMKVDVDGAPQAIAELAAINQVADRVDGRNVNLKTNSGVSALEALGSSIDKVATRMRSLQQVGSVAVIPGLVAAVGAIPAIVTPAVAALGALAGAMGAGLAGAAAVGGGALTALVGSIGLIATPITMLLSKLGNFDESLEKVAAKENTAATAAKTYGDAQSKVGEAVANRGQVESDVAASVGDAWNQYQRQQEETAQVSQQAAQDSADAWKEYERQQEETAQTAIDVQQANEDAAQGLEDARVDLAGATGAVVREQREYNEALEDEPRNQAYAALDLADARDRASDALRDYNEAVKEHGKNSEEATDAARTLERAELDLGRQREETNDIQKNGSKELRDAYGELVSAQTDRGQAAIGVARAEQNADRIAAEGTQRMREARRAEADQYESFLRTQAEGAQQVKEAQQAEADQFEAYRRAQADGSRQIAAAQKQVEDAQAAAAEAAKALAVAERGVLDEIVPLTAAQKRLYDEFQRFKAIALTAFTPAMDQAARLGVQILQLAGTAMPSLGRASLATMNALTRVFGTFRTEISKPVEQSSLNRFLRTIPSFTEVAGNAFVKFSLAMLNFFARTLPYVMQWVRSLDRGAQSFLNFTRSASGMAAIDRFLAYTTQKAVELWQATKNLAVGFFGLYSAMDQAGLVNQVWGGFLRLTEQFRQLTARGTESRQMVVQFFQASQPVLSALWSLLGGLVNQWFRVANAVMTMRNETGKLVLPQALKDIQAALPIIGDMLIAAFRNFGPYIGPIIQGVAELLKYYIALNPVLIAVTRGFAWLLTKFRGLDHSTKQTIVSIVSLRLAFAIIAPVIAALFSPIGRLVGGFGLLATRLGFFTGAAGRARIAAVGLRFAWTAMLGPVGIVIAGIAALAAGLVYAYRNNEQFRNGVNRAWAQIQAVAMPVIRVISGLLRGALAGALRFARTQAQGFGNWWTQNLPLMRQVAQVVMASIQRVFQGSFNRVKLIVTTVGRIISALWGRNMRQMLSIARSVWRIIYGTVDTAIRIIGNVLKLGMQVITGDWRGALRTLFRIGQLVWNQISLVFRETLRIIGNVVRIAMNNIRGIWETTLRAIRQWAEGWATRITNLFQALANFARGLWRRAWDTIRGIWESATRRIREWVQGWKQKIQDTFQNLANFARGLWRRAWDSIRQTWENQTRKVREWVQGWAGNLKNIMGGLRDAIWGAMKSIGKALWKPIEDGWSKAKEIWNSIIDAISGVADKFGLDSIKKKLKGAKFGGGGGNAPASPAQERAKGGIDYAAKGGDFRRPRQPKLIEYGEGPADEAAIFVSKDRRHRRDNEKYTGVAANMLGGRFIPEGQLRKPGRYGEAFARGGLYKGKSNRSEMRRSGGYAEDYPTHYNIRSGVKSRVDEVNANTGGDYWNTYYGHPGGDANSVDWWGRGGRGAPVGTSTGTGIANYITDKLWKGLNWIIWNSQINSGGGWQAHTGPFDHRDHVHATWQDNGGGFGGSMGGASGGGGILGAITNPVATFWDKTIQPMADKFTGALGEGNIMNQVLAEAGKKLVGGLREKIVGSGGSGGVGGPISGSQAEVAKQFAAGAEGRGIPGPLPVMTALVESGMKNLNYGDRDSVGYFQQRPSQGWGTPEQLQDPAYALDAFLDAAEQYKGQYSNDAGGLGAWAQAVQRSAFPDRYAQEYGRAKELIGYDTGGLVKKEHQAILHPNELALPLNHPRTAPLLQSMAGTDRLEKELQETRRVLNETLVRQERQMVKVKEWARAQEAATRKAIGSGRADSELGNYMLKALDS